MPKVLKRDKKAALEALDGIIDIAKNDMLRQGTYQTGVINEELKQQGAVCGGQAACLYGSLWIAAGYRRKSTDGRLAGVASDKRDRYMKKHPELKLASDALNEAAAKRIARLPKEDRAAIEDSAENEYYGFLAEAYFESGVVHIDNTEGWNNPDSNDYWEKADPNKIISLVRSAKQIVEAA